MERVGEELPRDSAHFGTGIFRDVSDEDLATLRDMAKTFVFGEEIQAEQRIGSIDQAGREVYSMGTRDASLDIDGEGKSVLLVLFDKAKD